MKYPLFLLLAIGLSAPVLSPAEDLSNSSSPIKHVLLLSVDGMHEVDLLNCFFGRSAVNNGQPYCPNLAALAANGLNYTAASATKPSDSFPGLMGIVTGSSPRTMGIYYDVAYDRSLAPPAVTTGNGVAGGACTPGVIPGSRTEYEEGIDYDQTKLNGGAPGAALTEGGVASINPQRLVRDPSNNCAPVTPWNFVRTNTVFGVVHAAGGYTAWSDKHPSYSSVSGPGNGTNIDDYYSPEINSTVVPLPGVTTPLGLSCATVPDGTQLNSWTNSFANIQCYDTLKVNAIVNQASGKTHNGAASAPVPALFGMNFQVVSVGQKLIEKGVGTGGYQSEDGLPSPLLLKEIQFVDASIGQIVAALKASGNFYNTVIIVTAKHGQSPIDPNLFKPIPGSSGTNGTTPANLLNDLLPLSEQPTNPTGIGATEDDISLLWLADQTTGASAVATLEQNLSNIGAGEIFAGGPRSSSTTTRAGSAAALIRVRRTSSSNRMSASFIPAAPRSRPSTAALLMTTPT